MKLEALITGEYGRPREEARYGALAMTPQKFKDETLRALTETVEAIARRSPTVLLFEDAHWADPTTLEALV